MHTIKTSSLLALAAAVALAGCSGNPSSGSTAYKPGELGNGDFLFACDDSVACDRWSTGDAADFPDQIATGANFDVRFVSKGQQGSSITINEKRYDGITVQPVRPNIGSGPDGFSSEKPGFATVTARDNRGMIIDYTTLRFVEPDALVVYKADYKGNDPPQVQAMNLTVGATESFRAVAQYKLSSVAGSVRINWSSADSNIVQVESYSRGVVRFVAKGAGKTTLTAVGAALTKEIEVEVKP